MPQPLQGQWSPLQNISVKQYTCGYCDAYVASGHGIFFSPGAACAIYICPGCLRPTYIEGTSQAPGASFGGKVQHITTDVSGLYDEARKCTSAGAYTAAVLACRKLLMHIAVDKGAEQGRSFMEYVEFLSSKGYITPDAKGWVDAIRIKGNEANHEIKMMSPNDARDLLTLVEMLLKIIYEFPGRVPKAATLSQVLTVGFLIRDTPAAPARRQSEWGAPLPSPCPRQYCCNSTTANLPAASPALSARDLGACVPTRHQSG
jgi:hypothetical protein